MAVIANSNQFTLQTTVRRSGDPSQTSTLFFEGVTPTADVGTIQLIRIPPGKVRLYPLKSAFICANMAATANVSLGYGAYTDANTAAVAANVVEFMAATLANACVLANAVFDAPANMSFLFDSLTGVTITATVTTANTVVNATYSGYVSISRV